MLLSIGSINIIIMTSLRFLVMRKVKWGCAFVVFYVYLACNSCLICRIMLTSHCIIINDNRCKTKILIQDGGEKNYLYVCVFAHNDACYGSKKGDKHSAQLDKIRQKF